MAKNTLSHHDRYVRSIMENPKAIGEFLQHYIPENVRSVMDLDHVVLQKDSFIDDKLRLKTADLLYQTKFNGSDGFLYVLLEHASTPDKMLPFRLLQYITAIQAHHLKQKKTKVLPFVYPVVLYTGNKKYPHSMDLFTLFGPTETVARETYANPYHLVDLTKIPDAALKAQLWFGTMSLVAKHIHDPNFLPFLREIMGAFRELEKSGGDQYVRVTMSYIIEAGETPNWDDFTQTIEKLEIVEKGNGMKIADYLRQEGFNQALALADVWKKEEFEKGIERGIERGIEQGVHDGFAKGADVGFSQAIKTVAMTMLGNGLTVSDVSRYTGLSESQIQELKIPIH